MFKIILFLACSGLLLYANRKYISIGSRVEKSNYTPPKPNIEYVGPAVAGPVIIEPSKMWAERGVIDSLTTQERVVSAKAQTEGYNEDIKSFRSSKSEVMKEQLFLELAEKHKKDVLFIECVYHRVKNSDPPLAYINSIYDIKLTVDDLIKINSVMEREKWM